MGLDSATKQNKCDESSNSEQAITNKEKSKCVRFQNGECTNACYICIDALARNFGLTELNYDSFQELKESKE